MKIYYICAAVVFLSVYAIFHFGFREGGDGQLYRINDELVFEVRPEAESFNGLGIHGFQPTNRVIAFLCGACQRDDAKVFMRNVNYRKGDWVYTDFPQHKQAKTDIVNLRTGETIEASVPANFEYGDDLSKIPEYNQRGLDKTNENKLTQDYVKANFQPLSSYTTRCANAHILFAVAAIILAFIKQFIRAVDAMVNSNGEYDSTTHWHYMGD